MALIAKQERGQAKKGGAVEEARFSLRMTSVYRTEDEVWMLLHRLTDRISTSRAAETVFAL